MNLEGIESLNYRVASAGLGGRIEVRVDSLKGPPLARCAWAVRAIGKFTRT